MIQDQARINNCRCRPLITTSYQLLQKNQQEFLPCLELPYNYVLKDIKNLETYVCSSARIIGIDFIEKPKDVPRLTYKNILFNKKGEKGDKIEFKSLEKYQKFHWTLDLISTYSQLSHQPKQQLNKHFFQNIHILNEASYLSMNPFITFQKLTKSKIVCAIKRQKNQKKEKLFICRIPITIVLPVLQEYETKKILRVLSGDISKAVHIMISHSLRYRVIQIHQNTVPIQNYFQNKQSQKKQKNRVFQNFWKGHTKNRQKNKLSAQDGSLSKDSGTEKLEYSSGNDKKKAKLEILGAKDIKNVNFVQTIGLVLLLLSIIGFYAYIKLS